MDGHDGEPDAGPVRALRVSKMRNAVFTLSNWTAEEYEIIMHRLDYSYVIVGKEIAPTTGTPHFQGYLEYPNPRSFNTVTRQLFRRAHIEPRRGTQAQAIEYCKKDGDWKEAGTKGAQGRRVDVANMMELIETGGGELACWRADPMLMMQYSRAWSEFRELIAPERDVNAVRDVRLYWGATGLGKTRAAVTEFPDISFHLAGKWFDTYTHGRAYLFDDFEPSDITLGQLLNVLDRYRISVEIKGGSRKWNPPTIIITSNDPLEVWYPDVSQARRDGLRRRFTEIRHFT